MRPAGKALTKIWRALLPSLLAGLLAPMLPAAANAADNPRSLCWRGMSFPAGFAAVLAIALLLVWGSSAVATLRARRNSCRPA